MADYIRDLRPAKWGSMINLRCKKILNGPSGLFSNSGRAGFAGDGCCGVGTSALYERQLHAG